MRGRESKQYIPHEYILLTDRNDTSDRWVSTDAKALRRFWYRKYFEYLENIGYPKARYVQRLELQVATGFWDAFRYSVCITIEIPRKVRVHRKCIRVLSFRFALLYRGNWSASYDSYPISYYSLLNTVVNINRRLAHSSHVNREYQIKSCYSP